MEIITIQVEDRTPVVNTNLYSPGDYMLIDVYAAQVVANTAKVSFPEAPADGEEYVRKDGAWAIKSGGAGSGDMTQAVYDPTSVAGDAFDMDNMVEGATNKILTTGERVDIATNNLKVSFPGFTSLNADYGYTEPTHSWAEITGKPTTLSGFGISDTKTNFNAALSDGSFMYVGDAPTTHIHTASEVVDFDTEVSNNTSVVANTAKVSFPEAPNDGQEYVRKNQAWAVVTGGGSGDMLAATYDPGNVAGDAFDMDNMVEGTTTKILTATERTNIATNTAKVSFPGFTSLAADYGYSEPTHTLADLTDVTAALQTAGFVIASSGGNYTGRALLTSDIPDLSGTYSTTGHGHTASNISDFDTEVSNNASVVANTAKTSFPGFTSLAVDYGYSEPTHALADLTDVDGTVASPNDGDILVFRTAGGDWILETKPTPGGGGATQLSELSDVTTAVQTAGFVIASSGGDYAGRALLTSDIPDLSATYSTTGHGHTASDISDFDTEVSNNTSVTANTAKVSFPGFTSLNADYGYTEPTHETNDLTDVANSAPADKHVLIYDGVTDNRYENRALVEADISDLGPYNNYSHPNHGGDLSGTGDGNYNVHGIYGVALDSTVGSPNDGDILVYRSAGGDWVLETKPTPGGGGATQLSELSDVTSATQTAGFVIASSGGDYIGRALLTTDIPDLSATYSTTGHGHTASDISDFDTEVSNNASVTANTAKVSFPGFSTLAADYGYSEPVHAVNDLSDVANTTPSDKHVLIYDGVTDNRYENRALVEADISDFGSYSTTGHGHTASEISDFDTEVSNNASVTANTAKVSFPGFTSLLADYGYTEPTHAMDDLTDVANSAPADRHVLIYDGTVDNRYENRLLVEADISNLGAYITDITGQTLSQLSDVPSEPTGGSATYVLRWNDTGDTFSWFDDSGYGGGGGDMLLGTAQTITAAKTFNDNTLLLDDADSAFNLTVRSASTMTADRSLTFDVNDASRVVTVAGDTTISGSNTGDETDMSGISDTKANFDSALSDGSFMYTGDAPTAHTHSLTDVTDVTATAAEVNLLDLAGLTAGWVLRATGASSASWSQLAFADINSTPTTLSGYGISDTKANFNTALSDGSFQFVGDAPTAHTLDSHSNVTITSNTTGELLQWNGSAWINQTTDELGLAKDSGDTIVVGDHGTASTDEVVNVCYGTGATPPAAGTVTEGALYIQYTP